MQYCRFNLNDFAAGTHDHWIVLMESLPETVFHAWKGRKMQNTWLFLIDSSHRPNQWPNGFLGQTVGNPPQEPQEGLRLAAGLKEILGQVETAIPGRLGDLQPKIVMEYTPDAIFNI